MMSLKWEEIQTVQVRKIQEMNYNRKKIVMVNVFVKLRNKKKLKDHQSRMVFCKVEILIDK